MLWLPLVSLSSVLLYQATNAGLYLIALGAYFSGVSEGEVSTLSSSTWGWRGRCER